MYYVSYFFFTFIISIVCTGFVAIIMRKFGIVDKVKREKRKIHRRTVPLGGGWAVFLSFVMVIGLILLFNKNGQDGDFFIHDIVLKNLWGLFFGGLVLMIGGTIDDMFSLRPRYQLAFPILATLVIIFFGIGPHEITNPFGGTVDLSQWSISIDGLGNWVIFADMLVFMWLMGMMYTTKFLDGLDGLVSGVVAIGAFIIFFLALQPMWYQPDVALLSIVFAGSLLGFLVWNWHPAKIFLGEGGSLFAGFMLGSLAIISGGKIATTLLVVALPMLDLIRVVIRRYQKHKPIYQGDKEHLHFRLLDSGLSQRQAVLLFYTISLLFGMSALFLQSSQKLIALVFLFILMLLVGVWFGKKE